MSWNEHHSRSEHLASLAEASLRAGDIGRAESYFREAADEEERALSALRPEKHKTIGITAVSAAALWYKAGDFSAAELIAYRSLGRGDLPAFARRQLQDLLQLVWTTKDAQERGIRFVPGDVLVAVKGGQVVRGGAPLDLIVRKVEEIQAVFFRTIEMLLDLPVRRHGNAPHEVQEWFRPWLFQAPASSYQFAVRVQEPTQAELFPVQRPNVDRVTATFMDILRASSVDPEAELPKIVVDRGYREVFLKLSRNLAPTGKTFERLEIRDASVPSLAPVSFAPDTRREINTALRDFRPPRPDRTQEETVQIRGTLRGVHLDGDWLDVQATDPMAGQVHIIKAGEVLDDVIGPMVNRRVIVTAIKRGERYEYQDIEPEE